MATGHQVNVYTGMIGTATRAEIAEAARSGHITESQAKVLASNAKK